jgi:hypothetical protein
VRRIALGMVLIVCAFTAKASSVDDERLSVHLAALAAELPRPARQVLAVMNTPQRKLLAARSYAKAGEDLLARWSWSAEEIRRFEESTEYRRLLAGVDAVKNEFELRNPGYSLYANMQVRTLELQLERWNANAGVANVAHELYRAVQRELLTHPYAAGSDSASTARLKRFLLQWHPSTAAPLAAPGLSAHGQLRAIDFQITRGEQVIAGTSVAAVRRTWELPGWDERLRLAVQSVGSQFIGPLRAPNEPWHYTYVAAEQSAELRSSCEVRSC